jgi:glutathione reductase (NADPH)
MAKRSGQNTLIATGSAPNRGPAIQHRTRDLIERSVSSPALPRRIVIQGGGYIALEFACIFAGFGST